MSGVPSVDSAIYMTPSPAAVARPIATYSLDAAMERWHWMGERTICTLAQVGRAQAGAAPRRPKRTQRYSDADAAVAIEAAHVFGSARRGLRAAGILAGTNPHILHAARRLVPPCITEEERGLGVRLVLAGRQGDTAGQDARHAHERAVGRVLRIALALMPEQPMTGRYRLPPADATLAEALAGEDPAAVAAVFPDTAMEAR